MLERLRAFFDARDGWTKATDAAAETHPHGAAILALADSATGANPTRAFKDASAQLYAHRAFAVTLLATALAHEGDGIEPDTGNRLRGLAWLTADAGGEEAAHVLARLAVFGWEKVRWHGPRSQKAANAAIRALATLPEGAPQLARLREQLKNPQALKAIDVAIGESAGRLGIPREEFEERVVPEPDLTPIEINGYRACVTLDGMLRFANANGRELKTTPAAVRGAPELATLRARAKDVAGIVAGQRSRLERLLMHDRAWAFDTWRERYQEHTLVGPLARRLIWVVDGVPALGADITQGVEVRLWHPIDADPDTVLAWRRTLERRELTQPFKQAHREIYVLTPAEQQTRTYSNRFAAHILRQSQLGALARARGWQYAIRGGWDSGEAGPTLTLPELGLNATFWVEGTQEHDELGVFTHVASDQVQFDDHDLTTIDRRVFSEVMRDVDLFVAVTSIGNDPTWIDGGTDRAHAGYWRDYAFGELGAQAEVRRDLLEHLLPKLAIRDVATLDGRYLRVRGTRRSYKIHLGSANILMEPNDQYLCIVAARGPRADVHLPFEGDRLLAVILSKAFLLARDNQIDDETILTQIGA